MKIIIEIDTSNAAFEDDRYEVLRILQEISDRAEMKGQIESRNLLDVNGNRCGTIRVQR